MRVNVECELGVFGNDNRRGNGELVSVSCELEPKLIAGDLSKGEGAWVGVWPMALRQMTDLMLKRVKECIAQGN